MKVKKVTYKMKKALSETLESLKIGQPFFIEPDDFPLISVRTTVDRLKLKGMDFNLYNHNGGALITRIK